MRTSKETHICRLEEEFEKCVCDSFAAGMSVFEITRTIGKQRALFIYKMLQRNRLIGKGLKRNRHMGPANMQPALKRSGLSFAQWCNSWSFIPEEAERVLLQGKEHYGEQPHMEAAKRDFPPMFTKVDRQTPYDLEEWEKEIDLEGASYSYHIDWDSKRGVYEGTIPGIDSLKIIGKRPGDILITLERVSWLKTSVSMLKLHSPKIF